MLPLTLSEAVENLIRAKFVEFVASKKRHEFHRAAEPTKSMNETTDEHR